MDEYKVPRLPAAAKTPDENVCKEEMLQQIKKMELVSADNARQIEEIRMGRQRLLDRVRQMALKYGGDDDDENGTRREDRTGTL
uniref:Smoothelin domain-containing protein n=1 Tax=Steinernema glaseri TaxID=37863 RepID=A0A1I7ZAS9_9BILA